MKTEKTILIAFVLNLCFSIFEFFGGIFTGSVAIVSDAVHDFGDVISIGIAYFLEKQSKKQPDETFTYGYARYSVIGAALSALVLLCGSAIVIYNAIDRIIHPIPLHYDGMLVFAVIGVLVNTTAALFTRHGDSLNQKTVNLHMLEDVLGWFVVLLGAITIKFTDLVLLDPILSVCVAGFILINAVKHIKEVLDIFLEKTPHGICIAEIKAQLQNLENVTDVHHIHVWSMDGENHYATMHVVTNADQHQIKHTIRDRLHAYGIEHVTLELESENEPCHEKCCHPKSNGHAGHHHHHHH